MRGCLRLYYRDSGEGDSWIQTADIVGYMGKKSQLPEARRPVLFLLPLSVSEFSVNDIVAEFIEGDIDTCIVIHHWVKRIIRCS